VDLKKLIMNNSNLEMQQKEKLIEVLLRYTEFLTTRPGKCKAYEYKYNITDTTPTIGHSRPVLCSARAGVRKQIEQMMEDGILELSDSSFINLLTTVHRENREPRICIDARRVNNVMLSDRVNEAVLLKCQPTSDAALGITAKFMRPFDGPWVITKIIPPSC
jgi:hypothetical protein